MRDEIIEELWQVKDELAREANYDVHVLCQRLRERQAHSSAQVVDRSAREMAAETVARVAGEDDLLVDDLLQSNAEFQALAAKSKAGPRKLFPPAR